MGGSRKKLLKFSPFERIMTVLRLYAEFTCHLTQIHNSFANVFSDYAQQFFFRVDGIIDEVVDMNGTVFQSFIIERLTIDQAKVTS